jgi:peptidyl-prolyl cis-trans isomerase C
LSDVPAEPVGDGVPASSGGGGWFGRYRVPIIVVVIALIAGGAAIVMASRGGSCPSDGAVIEVDGETVTEDQLSRRAELVEALYGLSPPTDAKRADSYRRELAKSLATALIIDGEAARRDIVVPDRTVRDALARYIADFFPEGGRDQFVQAMGDKGVSEAEVLGEFRQIQTTFRVLDRVSSDVAVSDADVTAAYEERKDELVVPERRRIRHIVVGSEPEASGALERLRGGEPFADVAKAVSLDASTKDTGGDLGPRAASELEKAFGDAAFGIAQGEFFGPVETRFGWHVGLVEEIVAGRALTAEEAREPLREQLLAERKLADQRDFVASLLRDTDVCYADRFRPARPNDPPPGVTPGQEGTTPGADEPSGR